MDKLDKPNEKSSEFSVAKSDPSWRGLYKAGAISAVLYVLFATVVPFFYVYKSHAANRDG